VTPLTDGLRILDNIRRHGRGHDQFIVTRRPCSETGGISMTAVLASILTGLFTLSAAMTTLFLQGRHQREMVQDERLWSRRAETYVALLQYQGMGMIEGYQGSATAREFAMRDELTAKAAAFASDALRNQWQQSALASLALEEHVSEGWPEWSAAKGAQQLDVEQEMEEDLEFRNLRQAVVDARTRLTAQIRAELRSADPTTRRSGN
jgi:hypothetical protein